VSEVEDFDPALIYFDAQVEVAANVFETLLIADGEGRLLPLLCRDWTMSDEGRTFTFTLRDGVRFHDGAPLTAAEVKRSFETTIRHRGEEMRAAMAVIEGVRAFLDGESDDVKGIVASAEDRIEFHLSEPLSIYPSLLTEANTGIARGEIQGGKGRTIGTGPFRIASVADDRIVLERYPEYWKEPSLIDAVEFRPNVAPSSIADGLRTGELDLARSLPEEDLERLLRDPRFRGRMDEMPGKSTFFILFNTLKGPFARNADLRRALCGLIRVRDLIWHTKGRLAEPAAGIVPPGLLGHDPGRRRRLISVEEARELIAKAGLPTPLRLKAGVTPASAVRHQDLLRSISATWAEVGVELEIVTQTQEAYNEMVAEPEGVDIALLGYISDYDDPDSMTYVLFDSKTGRYRKFFSSPESDELLQKARTEGRPEKRIALYRRFEDLLEEEGAILPLFHETNYRIPGPRVRGMRLVSTPPYVNYRELAKAETEISSREQAAHGKGTLNIPILGVMAQSLDPMKATHIDEAEVGSCIFETLTRVEDGARLVPWLVSSIELEDGGKTYRLTLRDGIRFHDGRRLGPRDVRFSFERVLAAEECEFRFLLSPIVGSNAIIKGESKELEGFRIHSAREFSIHLEAPVPFFPAVLSHFGLGIVPEGVDFEARSFRDGLSGTGPFRVLQFEPGRRVEMERNPNYWRPGYPKSEGIAFEGVEDGEQIYQGFLGGRYSLGYYLPVERFEELRRSSEYAGGYREIPSLSTALLALNSKKGPLRDPELRRRLSAAIDRAAICRAVSGASPAPARGLIPPGLLGHDPGGDSSSSAMRSGAEAGPEIELSVAISPALRTAFSQAVDQVTLELQNHGIRLKKLPLKDRKEFNDHLTQGSCDLILGAWVADYPDTHAMIHGILDSREGWAGRFCGSPELDREIQRAQVEADPVTRNTLYRDIERRVARECWVVPLFYLTVYRFTRPEVKGLHLSFSTPDVRYEDLHITT
jgi:peptide/nickel transport system substrate-binding protein